MKSQPNRLAIDQRHLLGGVSIDRNLPLRFRLDGRTIHGFEGDTVLSAVLASGIDSAGMRAGFPMALGARFAPPVIHAAERHDLRYALPMARTPAVDGAELRSLANHKISVPGLSRAFARFRPAHSLDLDLDKAPLTSPPWLDAPVGASHNCDVIVVGGGVAGLSAAVEAAQSGRNVVLIEASPVLGGAARLFGRLEGEETPDQSIARLTAAVSGMDAITIVTRAEVFAARPGLVRVHLVSNENGRPRGRIVEFRAAAIVLATGAIERLPIFAGNRLPGVIGVQEAYERAYLYGVWQGKSAVLTTVSSAAYGLAMLASDAGITIGKIVDGRPHPQSRFIEFCKAYGMTQSPGMAPAHAEWLGPRKGLSVSLQLALEGVAHTEQPEPVLTDGLIACGGWQPELSLWHMAGGRSQWNAQDTRIEPGPGPAGIALAGSAARYFSKQACLQSGEDAVRQLLGVGRMPVLEHLVDPIYETPDGPTPISDSPGSAGPAAYLEAGTSLIARPNSPAPVPGWRRYLPFTASPPSWSLADHPQALSVCDVAAGVQLGAIPSASAGIVAQERAAASLDMVDNAAREPDVRPQTGSGAIVPDFLAGRFGPAPSLWTIIPAEARILEVGALIFVNSDQSDPRQAIGVIIRADDAVTLALIGKPAVHAGEGAIVRDQGRPVPIRLGEPFKANGAGLGAPLGGETSPL